MFEFTKGENYHTRLSAYTGSQKHQGLNSYMNMPHIQSLAYRRVRTLTLKFRLKIASRVYLSCIIMSQCFMKMRRKNGFMDGNKTGVVYCCSPHVSSGYVLSMRVVSAGRDVPLSRGNMDNVCIQ